VINYTPTGGAPTSKSGSVSHILPAPVSNPVFLKYADTTQYVDGGTNSYFATIESRNNGTTTQDHTIIEYIPAEVNLGSIG
jgi:hypothetical protein